jgi:hypothetical protein
MGSTVHEHQRRQQRGFTTIGSGGDTTSDDVLAPPVTQARRHRLRLTGVGSGDAAGGMTAREREVLVLVADARNQRPGRRRTVHITQDRQRARLTDHQQARGAQ